MGAAGGSSPFWMVLYGDSSSNKATALDLDGSDNIVVVGTEILKFAIDGSLTFQKTLGGSVLYDTQGVAVDSNGNIFIPSAASGYEGSYDAITLKYNSSGVQQWGKAYGQTNLDMNLAIALDSSGNNYSVGLMRNSHYNKSAMLKYNSSGAAQWRKSLQWASSGEHGAAYAVSIDSSGNIVYGGYVGPISGEYPGGLHKVNSSGDLQYSKKITDGTSISIKGLASDGSGNTYAAAWAEGISPASGVKQGVVAKFNSSAAAQWGRKVSVNFSGTYKPVFFYGCALDSSDNLYVVGHAADTNNVTSGYIFKYNSSGAIQWQRRIGTGSTTGLRGVKVTSEDNIVVAGYINGVGSGNNDYFVAHLASDGSGTGTYASDITYESSSLTDAAQSYTVADYGYPFTDMDADETNISSSIIADVNLSSSLYSIS